MYAAIVGSPLASSSKIATASRRDEPGATDILAHVDPAEAELARLAQDVDREVLLGVPARGVAGRARSSAKSRTASTIAAAFVGQRGHAMPQCIVGMTKLAPFFDPVRANAGHRLGLGVEAERVGAVLVEVAEAGLLPAAERVVRDRHGDRHVDADHADLHAGGEVAGGVAVAGEDRDAVAVLVLGGQASASS